MCCCNLQSNHIYLYMVGTHTKNHHVRERERKKRKTREQYISERRKKQAKWLAKIEIEKVA